MRPHFDFYTRPPKCQIKHVYGYNKKETMEMMIDGDK